MIKTTVAGSLPKPIWLAEPETLWAPWRLEGQELIEGQQDAALAWIKIQEDAGIDIVSDGEQAASSGHWLGPINSLTPKPGSSGETCWRTT